MSDYQGNIVIKNPATPTGPSAYGSAPGMWKLNEVAYWIKQGVWPNPAITPDQYFPYVSLLLSTTSLGNANNNLFVDSSGAFNPINRNGNTTQGSFSPYATNWSNYFNGGTDRLQVPVTSNMYLGTTYTIEAWAYYNSSSYGARPIFSQTEAFQGGFAGLNLTLNTSGQLVAEYRPVTSGTVTTITGPTVVPNTWFHIALVSDSSSAKLYVNGTQVGVTTTFGDYPSAKTTFVAVGSWGHGWNDPGIPAAAWIGYISNMRVVKGTAVYTSNFTPSTTPLTAISGTVLLTCQSNRFIDNSSVNNTLTPVSTVSVQDFNPFSPSYPGAVYNQSDITNWSGYFDGSGDYLTVPYSTALQLPGDFTIETWVYLNSRATSFPCIVANYSTYATNGGFALFAGHNFNTTKYTVSFNGSFPVLTSSSSIVYGAWTHLAVVRSGSTLTLYVNGVSEATATNSATVTGTGNNWWIATSGDSTTSSYINGSISNLRVVKGTAVYTSNFTPPTTNLTAISGTSLLTLQNPAFTDNSTNNFVITPYDTTTVTGNSPFNTVGYWSNYFDGNDYIQAPDNAAFAFGTGDYTVEAWVYPTSIRNGENLIYVTEVTQGMAFGYNQTQVYIGARATAYDLLATYTMPTNQWVHVAATRQSGTARIFVNGTQVGSGTITRNNPQGAGTVGDYTGASNGNGVIGYISNARVIKGTALYTSNFTVPTSPLTAISGTSLLTCQNGRFIDNSTNAFTITAYGNTSTQSFDPFYTATIASNGGSMYFDGSGDYLALQNNPSFALGAGDFIVETWVYPLVQGGHGSNNNDCIIDFRPGTGGGAYGTLYIRSSGTGVSWYANTTNVINGGAIPNGAWSHLMVSRVSGSTRMFINGVQSGSTYTDSTNYLQSNPWIGQFNDGGGAGWFQGYMSGMRIVKGTGVSSAFTPPTAPVTPTAATTLLINGMNAGIYDATTINDMETVGNAQVSTVQSKFGGSSVYFDGTTSNRVKPPASALFAFGTGNFTVEAWVYVTNMTTENFVFDTRSSVSTAGMGFSLEPNTGKLRYSGNANNVLTSTAVTANTWTHVAWVRNGSTLTGYINGVAGGSASNSDNLTQTNGEIGNVPFSAVGTNMYIDEVRVTKGVARYTSNFTPPTQAFPVY